jgi:hypothetical protein
MPLSGEADVSSDLRIIIPTMHLPYYIRWLQHRIGLFDRLHQKTILADYLISDNPVVRSGGRLAAPPTVPFCIHRSFVRECLTRISHIKLGA